VVSAVGVDSQGESAIAEPAILVVDDLPANLLAFQAVLEPLGQPIATATSGHEALKQLLRRDFALLLVDVQMPEMDGFELAARIQPHPRLARIPIIFVTATNPDASNVFRGYAHGAVDYLLKPFEPELLRAKARVFSDLYRAQQTIRIQAERLHEAELREIERRNEERIHRLTKAMLEREREAREQAESANRMKDEFLATVSHELRTPLNAILGWTQVVRTGSLQEDRLSHAIETIERNARAQAALVNDLLDVSRIVSGRLYIELGPCFIDEVVDEVVNATRPAADAKRIALQWLRDLGPLPIHGDRLRLRQVVSNVLSNAVKFTPPGGKVGIRALRDGPSVNIVIEDNGEGIAADFLPFVFDRFRQQARPGGLATDGLGIGLSVASQLVELHRGRLLAESEGRGKGARFTIVLPTAGATPAPTPTR
jgi:signal transduction histidine kinase